MINRTRAAAARIVLAVAAVVGGLCLVAALAAAVLDLRPLVFRSGSMAPAIHTGDLAVAQSVPASELSVGDVVSVKTASGSRITHRVATMTQHDDTATLVLKGDANDAVDTEAYEVETADRVLFAVPRGGYVLSWFSGPVGLLLLGGYVVWLAGRLRAPARPESGRSHVPALAAVAVVGLGAGWGLTAPSPVTLAAWTDSVDVGGTTLAAGSVPAPSSFSCGALGVLSVSFNWTAVSGATSYTLHYGSGGASTLTTTSTSATVTTAVNAGTAWVQANRNFGSVTWSSVASQSRSYTVALASLCA